MKKIEINGLDCLELVIKQLTKMKWYERLVICIGIALHPRHALGEIAIKRDEILLREIKKR